MYQGADDGIADVLEAQVAENPDCGRDKNQANRQVRPKERRVGLREDIHAEDQIQSDDDVGHVKREHQDRQPKGTKKVQLYLFEPSLDGRDWIRIADLPQQN